MKVNPTLALITLLGIVPLLVISALGYRPAVTWLLLTLCASAAFILATRHLGHCLPGRRLGQLIAAVMITGLTLLQLVRMVSFYLQGESLNERLLRHLSFDALLTTGTAFIGLIIAAALYLIACLWLSYRLANSDRQRPRFVHLAAAALSLVLFLTLDPDLSHATKELRTLSQASDEAAKLTDQELISLNLHPKALAATPPTTRPAGKNLLLIYLESLEQSFTDEDQFPDLTPNLNRLRQQGLQFTNVRQTPGTSWTLAGMVASQCGTPLLTRGNFTPQNDLMRQGLLENAVCLGDILNSAGYNQHYLGGASLSFAGKGLFLARHGYQTLEGKDELLQRLGPSTPTKGWGLYDDTLMTTAFQRFQQLADSPEPFNLTFLTLDTHKPGRPSPSCPKYPNRDAVDLHAIYCSDYLLGQFIDRAKQHPRWRDTLVVIMSDHLAFPAVSTRYLTPDSIRRLLVTVLNSDLEPIVIDAAATHMDLPATLLNLLNVKTEQPFLAGRDLLDSPASWKPLDEDQNRRRIAAIRHINANHLSRSANLCATPEPLSVSNQGIQLADHPVRLSLRGWPIELDRIGKEYALAAKINAKGQLGTSTLIKSEDVSALLSANAANQANNSASHLLLITDTSTLPAALRKKVSTSKAPLVAALISPQAKILAIQTGNELTDLSLKLPQCEALLSHNSDDDNDNAPNLARLLTDTCNNPQQIARWTNNREQLQLPLVRYGKTLYRATLKREDNSEHYRLQDYRPAGRDAGKASPACIAVLLGEALVIPEIESNEGSELAVFRQHPQNGTGNMSFTLQHSEARNTSTTSQSQSHSEPQ